MVYSNNHHPYHNKSGGRINSHVGNVRFRKMVALHKADYIAKSTKKFEKAHIAASIVQEIRAMNPPGRFLKEDPDGAWYDIGDHKAIKKVGQALREDAPDAREEMESSSKKSDADEKTIISIERSENQKRETKKPSTHHGSCEPIVLNIQCPTLREEIPAFTSYPTTSKMDTFVGATGKNKSAAVAAALEGSGEMAFGRVFYPPPTPDDMEVSTGKDGSLISGLSFPSHLSSFILDQRQYPHRQSAQSGDLVSKAKIVASVKAPSSVASMSINSGMVSLPASLLSDLSESFLAMDIGEPLSLDHL